MSDNRGNLDQTDHYLSRLLTIFLSRNVGGSEEDPEQLGLFCFEFDFCKVVQFSECL